MKFENTFIVPVAPETAWPLLLDVPTIAPCLPGAEIIEVIGPNKYRGRASVKVGPVQLVFHGQAEIIAADAETMTARVIAKGNENKGRGNASAIIGFSMAPDPSGARINVVTDLNLAGAVAQYGRGAGLLKAIADQLVAQFAKNVESAIRSAGQEGVSPIPGKPMSGLGLLGGALKTAVQRKFGRAP